MTKCAQINYPNPKANTNTRFWLNHRSPIANLLACSAPSAGSWLHALPTPSLCLWLTNSEIRLSIGLRVGAPLVSIQIRLVQIDRHNGLSYSRSADGRHSVISRNPEKPSKGTDLGSRKEHKRCRYASQIFNIFRYIQVWIKEENRNPNWKHRDQTQMVPNTIYNIIIYMLNSANGTDSNKHEKQ